MGAEKKRKRIDPNSILSLRKIDLNVINIVASVFETYVFEGKRYPICCSIVYSSKDDGNIFK